MPTTGSPSEVAVAKPVTRFEQPGPEVTSATPAFPVMRPMPLAMKAAFCSCRQTMVLIFESASVSNTLSTFAPGMPKTYSTPWASRLFTNNSAPVCGAGFAAGVLTSFLLLLWREPPSDLDANRLSENLRFRAARCGNHLPAESAGEVSFPGTAGHGRRVRGPLK